MRTLVKSLLAFSAVVSLAPTAALAIPPQCIDCWLPNCNELCHVGSEQMTCADYYGYTCVAGAAVSEPTASVTGDEARQAEDASQVCSEEHPAAEQSLTAGT
ncbi:hypothetical protein HRD49_43980 [Corallococcus exiguus]|uniref:hypothetical protein n=1 Tax=Corallococcus TaxID=83461 RepID=UPI000EA1632B|nr:MULTISPECIES: hypothetical protein [Corallococcus]RKI40574.1 hypothetical protein D7Y27_20220 [Corallococcus sp. AB004]NPC70796.1 hypothetical protein [Corallococcus exiguus]NPD22125.1 hypothetical protein [Corallococcus exiguus]NRD48736.1 hypothetical protein [Corallococcus exiguus]NRD58437.1 hypothetical protein [Corallococcus exiguus]